MKKRIEVEMGGSVASSLGTSVDKVSQKIKGFSDEIKSLNRSVSDVSQYKKMRSEVLSVATEFRTSQKNLGGLGDELDKQKQKLTGLQEKLNSQRADVKSLSQTWRDKKESLSMAKNELLKARDAFAQTHQKLEGMTRVSKVATEKYNVQKESLKKLEGAYVRQYQSVKEARDSLEELKQTAKDTNDTLRSKTLTVKELGRNFSRKSRETETLSSKYASQKSKLETLSTSMKKAGVSVRSLENDERRLQKSIEATTSKMNAATKLKHTKARNKEVMRSAPGEVMSTAYAAIPFAGPVLKAASFEASGSNLKALANTNNGIGPEFENLKKMALNIGSDPNIKYDGIAAMDSMKYMAMAGMNAVGLKASVADVLRLSMAGDTESTEAADIGTNIMSAYGLTGQDMGDVGDILTKAFTSSNMTLGSMGEIMKYVGPVAGMLSKSDSKEDKKEILVKMSTMSGILGDAGISSSTAGTGLRKIATSLSAPTGESKTLLKEMGVDTKDSQGNLREIDDILIDISNSMEGLGTAEKTETLKKIFGEEALASAAVLVKKAGSGELKKAIANVSRYKGVMADIAKIKLDNVSGSFQALQSSVVGTSIKIGTTFLPVVRSVIDAATFGVNVVGTFAETFPILTATVLTAGSGLIALKIATLSYNIVSAVMSGSLITASKALYFLTGIQVGASEVTKGLTLKNIILSASTKEIAVSEFIAGKAKAFSNMVSKNALVVNALSIAQTVSRSVALGVLTLATGSTATATGILTMATTALTAAFITSPIGWYVAGIAALIGAVVLAYNKLDWFRNMVDWAWESLKKIGNAVSEFFGLSLPDMTVEANLDTSKALDQKKELEKELSKSKIDLGSPVVQSHEPTRPLARAKVENNLTAKVIDFKRKTVKERLMTDPVKDRIISRLPREIALAASLAASPVAAASVSKNVTDNNQVINNHGDVKHEYKFEMHIHDAGSKQIPQLKDEMEKLIKKQMDEAERKRLISQKRELMDRSKGGMF